MSPPTCTANAPVAVYPTGEPASPGVLAVSVWVPRVGPSVRVVLATPFEPVVVFVGFTEPPPTPTDQVTGICVAPWIRAVAVKVTGEPERFAPDAVTFCTTESEPVATIVVAIPSAPVVLELEPTVPPPTVGAQVMVTPFTGFPLGSLTITASGL